MPRATLFVGALLILTTFDGAQMPSRPTHGFVTDKTPMFCQAETDIKRIWRKFHLRKASASNHVRPHHPAILVTAEQLFAIAESPQAVVDSNSVVQNTVLN